MLVSLQFDICDGLYKTQHLRLFSIVSRYMHIAPTDQSMVQYVDSNYKVFIYSF